MGMYDELNKVSRAVNGQTLQKKKDAQYKVCLADLKIQLKDFLQIQLFEDLKNKENIFDIDYKMHTISQSIKDFKSTLKHVEIFEKYENELKIYLLSSYYNIANQTRIIVERSKKEKEDDYKKQIAFEKWDIQKQREQIRLQKETEQLKRLQKHFSLHI